MAKVVAQVSEDSRRAGRVAVERLVEKSVEELAQLIQDKRDIEFQLSQIEDWRKQETSKILQRRLNKSRSIEATVSLDADARHKKAPFMKDKLAVERRIHDIKARYKEKQRLQPREDVAVLLRIEELLIKLVEKLERISTNLQESE